MANNASYTVDYSDKRFTDVEDDRQQALSKLNKTYDKMINQTDKYYEDQINASKEWTETQKQNQQAQTDFTIEKIEQQKEQTRKDYIKEQSGAYVDWQRQSGDYGVSAEQIAAQGMANTGYAESSQVSMYNTYQNRVTTARESYTRAVLNYDNAIKEAKLQNNALLAEIAYKGLQTQLELSLAGFQCKNELIREKSNKQLEVEDVYYDRYQDVLKQINTENALAEEVRQYNASLAEEQRQYNASLALQKEQAEKKSSSGGSVKKSSGSSSSKSSGSSSAKTTVRNETVGKDGSDIKGTSNTSKLNQAIASGASKDQVSNAISLALRNGEITQKEANELRKTFTPRGYTY